MSFRREHREQLEQLFHQYSGVMVLYARSLLRDWQTAEDIVQEIFSEILATSRDLKDPKRYLLRCVHNRVLNRRRRPDPQFLRDDAEKPLWFSHPLEKQEEREILSAAMAGLPEEQRQVVVLKIWGELTFREISQMLDISANTVASRYRYALENLRGEMKDYFNGESR